MRTSSIQCHNNPVLVPPRKLPDPVKYLYDGQNCDLKTKSEYMDKDGCGSSGVWCIHSDISLYGVVLSVYYWDYLQVVLWDMV